MTPDLTVVGGWAADAPFNRHFGSHMDQESGE